MASAAAFRSVARVVRLARHTVKPGFHVWRMDSPVKPNLDPFLQCDWFAASQPTFPPHPHAGFSAVTMIFEESPGSFVNRDSTGHRSIIGPGDTHWTSAGSGIMHEELPEVNGVEGSGLQIFVNLAPEHKMSPARALRLSADNVPVLKTGSGAKVRVIAGEAGGLSSPLNDDLLTKVTLLDVTLPTGSSFTHSVPEGDTAFCWVLGGADVVVGPRAGEGAAAGTAAVHVPRESFCEFDKAGSALEVGCDGGPGGGPPARLVLFSGRPIGAPVVWQGPLCGNSREQVEAFAAAYKRGEMGSLEPSPVWSAAK